MVSCLIVPVSFDTDLGGVINAPKKACHGCASLLVIYADVSDQVPGETVIHEKFGLLAILY
jgi:hypothetical protein